MCHACATHVPRMCHAFDMHVPCAKHVTFVCHPCDLQLVGCSTRKCWLQGNEHITTCISNMCHAYATHVTCMWTAHIMYLLCMCKASTYHDTYGQALIMTFVKSSHCKLLPQENEWSTVACLYQPLKLHSLDLASIWNVCACVMCYLYLQYMPQSLHNILLRPYALDDYVLAGITRKPITARNALDAAFCRFKGLWPGESCAMHWHAKTKRW